MDSFILTVDLGSPSILILEFIRTGASAGTWSQIQIPKSSVAPAMGSWSQGPTNPGAGEFLGRALTHLGGDQTVDKDIWLYSYTTGTDEHVATIAGFPAFPPPP